MRNLKRFRERGKGRRSKGCGDESPPCQFTTVSFKKQIRILGVKGEYEKTTTRKENSVQPKHPPY